MARVLLEVMAVKDSAVDAYARPIFVPSIPVGVRSFSDEVNRESGDNQLFAHPDDFVLVHLASWDEETGRFENVEPRIICRAKDVRVK